MELARCRPRGNLKPQKISRPDATAAGSQAGHKEKLHVCVRQVRLLARGTRCAAISSAGRFILKKILPFAFPWNKQMDVSSMFILSTDLPGGVCDSV